MSAVKKQRIDLRLTDDDKSMIEEAAAISNQSVSQFMLNSASQRAAEVIEQCRVTDAPPCVPAAGTPSVIPSQIYGFSSVRTSLTAVR